LIIYVQLHDVKNIKKNRKGENETTCSTCACCHISCCCHTSNNYKTVSIVAELCLGYELDKMFGINFAAAYGVNIQCFMRNFAQMYLLSYLIRHYTAGDHY
jgi:hypothetical protein